MTQADGEKELVLGNRQLISLFFVVVALCGVFFAMGYLIGRNSTKGIVAGSGSGRRTRTRRRRPLRPCRTVEPRHRPRRPAARG